MILMIFCLCWLIFQSPDFYLYLWALYMVDIVDQPLHCTHQSTTLVILNRCYRINRPVTLQLMHAEPLTQCLQVHCSHVSFVGDDQDNCLLHIRMRQDPIHLIRCQLQPFAVRAIDHIDECLRLVEVMRPKVAQFLLAADIPNHKLYCFVAQLLDVESYGRNGADDLSKFKGIQDCSLSRAVETQHDHLALLLGDFLCEEMLEDVSHRLIFKVIIDRLIRVVMDDVNSE